MEENESLLERRIPFLEELNCCDVTRRSSRCDQSTGWQAPITSRRSRMELKGMKPLSRLKPVLMVQRNVNSTFTFHWAMYILFSTILAPTFSSSAMAAKVVQSSRVVSTKYGDLRGVMISLNNPSLDPVEAFLGVPYATPPLGNLRYMPPMTPSSWSGVKMAERLPPVCPQELPDISNKTEALQRMPASRYEFLKSIFPYLRNQSEDCLNMNIYVPTKVKAEEQLPVVVYIHGESFAWGAGNPYDGSVMASYGKIIVVTVNYRLGVLGFLKTTGNNQLMGTGFHDQLAAFHWLQENVATFGGDPSRITAMGHDTGAALVHYLLMSKITKGIIRRAILLSGSAICPWAFVADPVDTKKRVAEALNCTAANYDRDDVAPCVRKQPLGSLLNVDIPKPRFIPAYGPFIDESMVAAEPNYLLRKYRGDFDSVDLLMAVTNSESYLDFNEADVSVGFEEPRRDRILRTFVRNAYDFHLNEIFATIVSEYTDWERASKHPINIRESLVRALSDGHTVAPVVKTLKYHAKRNRNTYFAVFGYEDDSGKYPSRRLGSVRGEDLPFALGLPLVNGAPFFPENYTKQEVEVSKTFLEYLVNFAKFGNPNDVEPRPATFSSGKFKPIEWPVYDLQDQKYLEFSSKGLKVKNHYRAHKLALWLHLIPQLHQGGSDNEIQMIHHHFTNNSASSFDGHVKPLKFEPPAPMPTPSDEDAAATPDSDVEPSLLPSEKGGVDGFDPASSSSASSGAMGFDPSGRNRSGYGMFDQDGGNGSRLPRFLESYTTALSVTIAIGVSLLILNILIFAGVYYQRDKTRMEAKIYKRAQEELRKQQRSESSIGGTGENLGAITPSASTHGAAQLLHQQQQQQQQAQHDALLMDAHRVAMFAQTPTAAPPSTATPNHYPQGILRVSSNNPSVHGTATTMGNNVAVGNHVAKKTEFREATHPGMGMNMMGEEMTTFTGSLKRCHTGGHPQINSFPSHHLATLPRGGTGNGPLLPGGPSVRIADPGAHHQQQFQQQQYQMHNQLPHHQQQMHHQGQQASEQPGGMQEIRV